MWSSVDVYQEMTNLLVFNSFKRVPFSFFPEFMVVDNFN